MLSRLFRSVRVLPNTSKKVYKLLYEGQIQNYDINYLKIYKMATELGTYLFINITIG